MTQPQNPYVEQLNQSHGRKRYDLIDLNVVKTAESAPGTYTVYLSIDADYDADISSHINMTKAAHTSFVAEEGHYFPVGSGLGIPPAQDSALISRIIQSTAAPQSDDRDYLTPHNGYAGPDLSSPSDALLQKIVDSTLPSTQSQRLQAILNTPQDLAELKATYDVADILEIFPNTLTAKDIWALQPEVSMTKTYTILPEPDLSKAENKPCFSISVRLQKAESPQRLFGEPAGSSRLHEGAVSRHLCALKAGDTLPAVNLVKPQKGFKGTYEAARDVVFVAQGNAHERSLSYLHEKQADTAALKQQFILVSGFKQESDIPKNDAFSALAQNGTLSRVYYALSRDKNAPRQNAHEHYCTGKRVTDVLTDIDLTTLQSPIFYVAGSNEFCASVKTEIEDTLGAHADVRVSNSKTRIQKPSIAR
ncbi:MAG: hypothetical protein VYC19_06975 [Pseudomonadota bacterium]|nr:hypothetical protein [Pseudomonadota bacterium]MEC9235774.1 hypothetical protein [Pseudomonadota bacterium]MEE3322603.1 hypothetical protein [Pseudomonadota bacterium]